ncbi:hypothetical protein [Bartonella sp. F02]|uniref:hypothetical protein n=1 Tax=Bartonella sp. F02 TaxID=2967262 RepID=UPI0022A8E01C|nr:hypothetical protein [Bartonella sp. F02]MCZ2328551.1 hypothetical protein [Bartonella sp. F02]
MKNFYFYQIMIGILAGLFSSIIGIIIINVANIAPYLSPLLGCFISLPIFIVAFGRGTLSSFFALISATIMLAITNNFYIGFGFMLFFFLPAFYASWLLGLARPAQKENSLVWYPLSSVIFLLTNFIALISTFIGVYIQTNQSAPIIIKEITETIVQAMRQSQSISEADILAFSELLTTHAATLTAIILTVYSLIFLIGNLYFSMVTAQYLKWFTRPRDDWSQTFRLPISGLITFIVAGTGSMMRLGSILDLSTRVFATAYIVVIAISGLSYLHNITKGINGRTIILFFVYTAIFTVFFASPVFIMMLLMGIWATIQYHSKSRDKLH